MNSQKISGIILIIVACPFFFIPTLNAILNFENSQSLLRYLLENWEMYFTCFSLNLMGIPLMCGADVWELPLIESTLGRIQVSVRELAEKYNSNRHLKAISVATNGTGRIQLREYRLLENALEHL